MRIPMIDTTRRRRAAATMLVAAALVACRTSELLEANDPDIVAPENVESPAGADAVRLGAIQRWRLTTGADNTNGQESTWLFGGLLTDEWGTGSTFVQNDEVDKRAIGASNQTVTFAFRKLHRVRTAVNQAIPLMAKYRPTESTQIAELLFARAFAEMQLASDFCNGIPFSDAATSGSIEYGDPLTVDSVFKRAIATADSGIGLITATDSQATNILNGLRVVKARALLGLNRISEAGAAVANVPTSFVYNHTFSANVGSNAIWGQPFSGGRYLVGDSVDGNARDIRVLNAIPFFSSNDPRTPAFYTIATVGGKPDTAKSQDGLTLVRKLGRSTTQPVYAQFTSVTVTSGFDARLIEAEAQLAAGNPAWLTTLNTLRATPYVIGTITTPVMAALSDPGTADARINLLFREKAFWTFTRGQRLGDMRRLIRYYGRPATSVFPEGVHYRGGTYGTDVNLPVPQEEENNPKWRGCLDRNA
ncbi:MAG TPA: hypothetical protein VFT29_12515 [Gemmatimonadaceae bacterium]|nr:hypothetical protein [Gemmatimonadaceae bacterium]